MISAWIIKGSLGVADRHAQQTLAEQSAGSGPQYDGDEAGKNEGTELVTDVYGHQAPSGHPRLRGNIGTELHALGQYLESDAPALKRQEHGGTEQNFPPPGAFGKHQGEEQREAIGVDQRIDFRRQ